MSMEYFNEQTDGHLLNCVSLADKQKFIAAYNEMVDAINEYEKKIRLKYPDFDISKVFNIECLPDISSRKREFYKSIFVAKKYPEIPIDEVREIEKQIDGYISFILFTYKKRM